MSSYAANVAHKRSAKPRLRRRQIVLIRVIRRKVSQVSMISCAADGRGSGQAPQTLTGFGGPVVLD